MNKLLGDKELIKELKKLSISAKTKGVTFAVRKSSKMLMNDIKEHAPVDTGKARDSFRIKKRPKSKTPGRLVIYDIGPTDGWYLKFAELGTKYREAKPFMRPVLEMDQYKVLDVMKYELKRWFSRYSKRMQKAQK